MRPLPVRLVRPGDRSRAAVPTLRRATKAMGRGTGPHRTLDRRDEGARDARSAEEQARSPPRCRPRYSSGTSSPTPRQERAQERRTRPRRVLRRRTGRRPPTATHRRPPRVPRQGRRPPDRRSRHAGLPRTRPHRSRPSPTRTPTPEASSREVQNILLGLGALLLGVAAVVFAARGDQLARPWSAGRRSCCVATVLMLVAAAAAGPARVDLDRRDDRRASA